MRVARELEVGRMGAVPKRSRSGASSSSAAATAVSSDSEGEEQPGGSAAEAEAEPLVCKNISEYADIQLFYQLLAHLRHVTPNKLKYYVYAMKSDDTRREC